MNSCNAKPQAQQPIMMDAYRANYTLNLAIAHIIHAEILTIMRRGEEERSCGLLGDA